MMPSCGWNHGILSTFRKILPFILIGIIGIICLMTFPSQAQDESGSFIGSQGGTGDALDQAFGRAEAMFDDGLTTMNESTLRNAAALFEQIIQEFPNDPRHFNAYFSSAMIHIEYLQGASDYEHARNLLNLLMNNHPSSYPEVMDALLTLAQVEYRCLGDYRSAQEHLSAVLNNPMLSKELEYRDVDAKVLLAKCRQKLGEYDRSYDMWKEITLSSEAYDTEGRLKWHEEMDNWQFIDDGTVRLFFEIGTEWEPVLSEIRKDLLLAKTTWGIIDDRPVYIFLYSSSDSLFDYTLRYDGFALPEDAEIHISPSDMESIEHLTGWLVGGQLNSRSNESTLPLLRAGFNHYFMGSRDEINRLAAKELYFYGNMWTDDYLLFPIAYDYTFSDEYSAISSSFVHYLIDDGNISVNKLREFNRLLADSPAARLVPPMMEELSMLQDLSQIPEDVNIVGRQETLITPAEVYDLFRTKLGMDLSEVFVGWHDSLAPMIADVEQEFANMTSETERVETDLSTPEAALRTYWDAYIHGDIDTLIEASAAEPADFLISARDIWVERGILESVLIENFVLPNRGAIMRVISEGAIAEDRYVYKVRIERGGELEDRTYFLRKDDGKWKVDNN